MFAFCCVSSSGIGQMKRKSLYGIAGIDLVNAGFVAQLYVANVALANVIFEGMPPVLKSGSNARRWMSPQRFPSARNSILRSSRITLVNAFLSRKLATVNP